MKKMIQKNKEVINSTLSIVVVKESWWNLGQA